MVWVKMWVNCLTHIVTHIGISGFAAYCQLMPHGYNEMRGKNQRAPERNCFLSGALLACGTYRICAMKLPIFSAAFCCICRVTWV